MRRKLKNNIAVKSELLKTKWKLPFNFQHLSFNFFFAGVFVLFLLSCESKQASHEHTETYTCPMHPTVISNQPGVCPVCAMDLVRKAKPGEEVKITEDLARLINSTNEAVVSDVKTVKGEFASRKVKFELHGVVTYDERSVNSIASRVTGRLEKVYVKYNFQPVIKGQKIAEIYSEELVNAQREFLYVLKQDYSNTILLEAARKKLILLGATERQIQELQNKGSVYYTVAIYSPYTGYVVTQATKAPQANAQMSRPTGADGMGMGTSGTSAVVVSENVTDSQSILLKEGDYISQGQTILKVVSAANRWIEFSMAQQEARYIKKGDKIQLIDQAEKVLSVDFVEPTFSKDEPFVKVRSYLTESWPIGMLINATIEKATDELLWLPKSALINIGLESVVMVKQRGIFKPKPVETGLKSGGKVCITKGLLSSDEVALEAQYLIDSENFIKPN